MFHHQGLPFVATAIQIEFINHDHNNRLVGHLSIKKTRKLLTRKYYWLTIRHNVEAYVKDYDVCLALKVMRHKLYGDFQSLPVSTHWWKNLLMNFVTNLHISTNWKEDSHDSILVIVDWLTKMVYHKLVKIIINAPGLFEVIIDIVIHHHSLLNFIVTDKSFLFILKFWLLLCYFFDIKRWLFIAFYPQTDGQTKKQNSTIKPYLKALINFE